MLQLFSIWCIYGAAYLNQSAGRRFCFKGSVHCFSMQFVMNKCFLLNLKKNWRISVLPFREKRKKPFF